MLNLLKFAVGSVAGGSVVAMVATSRPLQVGAHCQVSIVVHR
jgi:hypothetical protein